MRIYLKRICLLSAFFFMVWVSWLGIELFSVTNVRTERTINPQDENADYSRMDIKHERSPHQNADVMISKASMENADVKDSESKMLCRNGSSLLKLGRSKAEFTFYTVALKRTVITSFNEEFVIKGEGICKKESGPFILIVVPSVPSHFGVRNVIRNTYGRFAKESANVEFRALLGKSVKLAFMIGKDGNQTTENELQKENHKHNDIVQADFLDTYNNLTRKMVLALKWASTYCAHADYFLKADEDVFVNIPALVKRLVEFETETNRKSASRDVILGHVHRKSPVRRSGRWGVKCEQYPFPTYPPYTSGNSYAISNKLVRTLYLASQYYQYIHIEDAFITGILARALEIRHENVMGFTFWLENKPKACSFVEENRITANKVDEKRMYELMEAVTHFGRSCRPYLPWYWLDSLKARSER